MGAHNALGAKLIEQAGFDAVWSSGFEIATAHGVPDANILTMTENLDAATNINAATQLPVICDCDTGFGNAVNAMHMVRKYEAAGLAAVVIEDKRFPKVNSFIPGRQELASIEEFTAKIEAMKTTRSSPDGILIFARIEALIAGWGIDEALRRAEAYEKAGADGIVIHSKAQTSAEIFSFAKKWKGSVPLVAIPTTYPQVTAEELLREGFKMVIYANQGLRAAVRAAQETLSRIQKEGTTRNVEGRIASMDELFRLQGMHTYQEQEKLYSNDGENITAVIPAAADHKFQPELSSLLQDQPLCMIKIGNKSLLERQKEILKSVGVREFIAVVGYKKEKIQRELPRLGIIPVENPSYDRFGSAYSVIRGISSSKGVGHRFLVAYSDIIFDPQIPRTLIQSPFPVTLVIDKGFRDLPERAKKLDLVITDESLDPRSRRMEFGNFKKIRHIGKEISQKDAQYEFIGMMLLSNEGALSLTNAWRDAEKENGKFHEAPNGKSASMTDLLQRMIEKGADVRGLVIEHGWSEIYSLEDYQRVNAYFEGSPKVYSGQA